MRVQRYEADPDCNKRIVIVNVLVNVNLDDEDLAGFDLTQEGLERLVTKVGDQIAGRT
jgi:hypothetical protein